MSARTTRARRALVIGGALLVAPAATRAQQTALRPHPELRTDAILGTVPAAQGGVGVVFPMGYYVRLTTTVAGGVSRVDGESVAGGRGDVLLRFLLDPFRESRWGLSAGGGASVRWEDRRGWRPFLAVVVDLEGPRSGGVSPAVQVGLGGGARVGLALRWSGASAR